MDPPRLAREKRRFRASLGGQASLLQARATPLHPLHPRAPAFPTTPSPHPPQWHRPIAAPAPPLLPRVAPPSTPCRHLASLASPNPRRRRRSAGRAGGVSGGARHAASAGGASEGGQERRQAVRHGRMAVQRRRRGSALSLASPLPSPRRRQLRSALSLSSSPPPRVVPAWWSSARRSPSLASSPRCKDELGGKLSGLKIFSVIIYSGRTYDMGGQVIAANSAPVITHLAKELGSEFEEMDSHKLALIDSQTGNIRDLEVAEDYVSMISLTLKLQVAMTKKIRPLGPMILLL